jgi:hypothetical protein
MTMVVFINELVDYLDVTISITMLTIIAT